MADATGLRAPQVWGGFVLAGALLLLILLLAAGCTLSPTEDLAYPGTTLSTSTTSEGPTAYPPPVLTQKAELATTRAREAAVEGTAAAVGVGDPVAATGMVSYTNEVLGLTFEYPAELGEVEFAIAPGDVGFGWAIRFSRFDALGFAGRSVDFSASRAGMHSDTLGFATNQDGDYLWQTVMWPEGQEIDVEEVIEVGDREVVLFRTAPLMSQPVEGVEYPLAALGNLVGERFPGFIVQNAEDERLPYETFLAILSTIEVYEPTAEPPGS